MERGGSHFEKLQKKSSFSANLKLVAVELTLHPVQRGPRTVTHAKLRNNHLPDDTSKRGDTSRTLRSIAVHCIAHTPPVNPCFLLQELRFQGHQKQQNRQPCGDSKLTGLSPPHALSKPGRSDRLFIALIESPDAFREVVPRLEISPPLIHMCDSTQNEEKQHAHAALKGFSVRHRESKLPLSFTFRGFCKKKLKKRQKKEEDISVCFAWVFGMTQTSYPCAEVVSSCLNS